MLFAEIAKRKYRPNEGRNREHLSANRVEIGKKLMNKNVIHS